MDLNRFAVEIACCARAFCESFLERSMCVNRCNVYYVVFEFRFYTFHRSEILFSHNDGLLLPQKCRPSFTTARYANNFAERYTRVYIIINPETGYTNVGCVGRRTYFRSHLPILSTIHDKLQLSIIYYYVKIKINELASRRPRGYNKTVFS